MATKLSGTLENLDESLPRTYFLSPDGGSPHGTDRPEPRASADDAITSLHPPRITTRSASDRDVFAGLQHSFLTRKPSGPSELVAECSGFIVEAEGESGGEGGVPAGLRRSFSFQQLDGSFRGRQSHGLMAFEHYDHNANYYRRHFFAKEHQNFVGFDPSGKPVAVSLRKETDKDDAGKTAFRAIIRTLEEGDIRMVLPESSVHIRSKLRMKATAKDVIVAMAPSIHVSRLQLVADPRMHELLLKIDEQMLIRQYKFGVMYCADGQSTEEDMYNNMTPSKHFSDFLQTIGETVQLKGFTGFRAGLDVKTDTTGTTSVYTRMYDGDVEVMFHVSTMLPATPANRQQLQRKRHIGNDIVTVIFQDPGAPPFSPLVIRSHFQHIFIVVRAVITAAGVRYRVSVTRFDDVPPFGPPLPNPPEFEAGPKFRDFLLHKLINAENAAYKAPKFAAMAQRTRSLLMADLVATFNMQPAEATQSTSSANSDHAKASRESSFDSLRRQSGRLFARTRLLPKTSTRAPVTWYAKMQDPSSPSTLVPVHVTVGAETFAITHEKSKVTYCSWQIESVVAAVLEPRKLRVSCGTDAFELMTSDADAIIRHMDTCVSRDASPRGSPTTQRKRSADVGAQSTSRGRNSSECATSPPADTHARTTSVLSDLDRPRAPSAPSEEQGRPYSTSWTAIEETSLVEALVARNVELTRKLEDVSRERDDLRAQLAVAQRTIATLRGAGNTDWDAVVDADEVEV